MTNIYRTKETDARQEETGETLIFHRKQRENADKSKYMARDKKKSEQE
jgi:hypothetical protein